MKILKALSVSAVLAILAYSAAPAAAQDRAEYKAASQYAESFCALEPASGDGLLGALVAADVYNIVFRMSESDAASMTDEDFSRLQEQSADKHTKELGNAEFKSCTNSGLTLFDCKEFNYYMTKEMLPKKASEKEFEAMYYDFQRTGDFFGADGLCGQVDMRFEFEGDDEKSTANVVIYEYEDEWYPLMIP